MKNLSSHLLRTLDKVHKPKDVYAHCDIPCGIYNPVSAQIAAQTVEKMVLKLEELKIPDDLKNQQAVLAYLNSVSRMVAVKEKHAQLCKKELLILWTDYFKPEHLTMFPNLHETFWKAAKLCSKNKQEVNLDAAKELRKAVDEIAHMFEKTESLKSK
ncbi:MAG: superoxide dismutase, Ni [Candidatus Portnoybacteria bacterium]|nr:superoxide dismutase, Ni [Candidatus Portnoybacteria bacterium]